ncbi:primosomal protein N' PriA [Butyrivibrio proteoclasticus B316]|uniref:Replication restart protein PriA n=1 Tax=Butyrivibrio proteoclasticus (strain ATCC 51982 / DSM 14932 / B316) TaxID=515622 RepID=E0RYN2_BUTPB|nr:primosomal protein N' [Butyrivibrio proteoclasticus]ADL34727.1 primosomal protein N' PriA [Butyrivibrio proteoclasticus B316]
MTALEYANIIIDISHEKVDRLFQYRIPDRLKDKVEVGCPVEVPFGKGNTMRKGYVLELTDEPNWDPDKIKEIAAVPEDKLGAEDISIRLAAWMKRYYGSTMIAALKTVLPATKKQNIQKHKFVSLRMDLRQAREYYYECASKKNQKARERILAELLLAPDDRIPYELITQKLHVTAATLKSLAEKGVIRIDEEEYYRKPIAGDSDRYGAKELSPEQQGIVDSFISDYDAGKRDTYLIHGITGSGKTEVYIALIDEIIKRGKQAIVLIPEIALTYQTLMRFYRHFGDRVSVMNSSLSPGEKYDQMERARTGDIDIIIGPRSALFTPFPNTGIIIIDEEHESSYKSESMPKYHARETAIELAKLVPGGASVVLGSATPSLESYYRATTGQYHLFELKRRLTGGTLPQVEIADLREELRTGNRSIFSRRLQELMEDRLNKGEQAMLFINRRGLAGFVSCRSCGYVFKCPHCDVSLSEHRGGRLVCHYCGYEQPLTKICPKCSSKYVSSFRAGTQQIEDEVKKMWPNARTLRMDADTTRTKGSYDRILSAFASKEADVLVGTQMIVKGHDFPDVTLVGILAADMSLHASDYRASERTFQLLTQAAGRAGRGEKPGNVVIQTYEPEHYSVQTASRQDYEAFYEEEIAYRDLLRYPPISHMMSVQILSYDEDLGMQFATRLRAIMEQNKRDGAIFIGPASAAIGKINDVYRMAVYVKMDDYDGLIAYKDMLEKYIHQLEDMGKLKKISVQFDFDPVNGF